MKDKTLRNYLLWAFGLAWPLQGVASYFTLQGQTQLFSVCATLVMFAPIAAVFLAKYPLRSIGWKLNLKGKVRWYLAAWLLPPVICALGAALYYLLFPAHLDLSLSALSASLGEAGQAQLDAQGMSLGRLALIEIAASMAYAPFINVVPVSARKPAGAAF